VTARAVLLLFMVAMSAQAAQSAGPASKSIRREFGPVTAIVEVSSDKITIGDVIECRFVVEAKEGVTVLSMPNLLQNPGQFAVLDYSPAQPTPISGGGFRQSSWFKLDPTLPGEYVISPQEIRFVDRRPGQDGGERRFETPEVRILVTGLVDGNAEWEKLKDLRGPRLRPLRIPWLWISIGIAALAAGLLLFRFRRKKRAIELPKPAHLIAELGLDRLMRENLIDRGEIEIFVTRLSVILRQYIENRFQLRAPRQSTEEFFEDLKSSPALSPSEKPMVMNFLRQADLVKFAAEWIDRERALALLDTVRQFVRLTRAPEAVAPVRAGGGPDAAKAA